MKFMYVQQAAKAIFATTAAGLGSLLTLLQSSHESITKVSSAGWVAVALTAIIAGGGVYNITNANKPPPAPTV